MKLELTADRQLVRPNGGTRHVLVRLVAPRGSDRQRAPVHVSFVIDRSGSMAGSKLRLAKTAVLQAIAALRGEDRFAVVAYDDRIDVVSPNACATGEARREATLRLQEFDARGSTDLHEGWAAGVREVAGGLAKEAIGRCLLLTDGLANRGVTEPTELAARAGEARTRGVATTTIGLGADFDERLLEAMADAGGGRFYFVERAEQIADCLAGELGEALEVVAREVVLEVRAPPGVTVLPLHRYPHQEVPGGVQVALGDLVSEQELELVLRVEIPPNGPGELRPIEVIVRDREGVLGAPQAALEFRHATGAEYDGQPRDFETMRAAAKQYASRARVEAMERNRAGDFRGAVLVLEDAIRGIRRRAHGDQGMLDIAAGLGRDRDELESPMDLMAMKRMHFTNSSISRDRDFTGRSRKNRS